VVTSFVFQVKNVPAALYKAMGGFATNGVNMTKLESYQLGGSFNATRFYVDIQGHPDQPHVARALEELAHGALAYVVYAVVALHIAATLWHVVVKKDETLARMWPRTSRNAS
jgi:prephenate dehydratase